jgi:hypothetical protein
MGFLDIDEFVAITDKEVRISRVITFEVLQHLLRS